MLSGVYFFYSDWFYGILLISQGDMRPPVRSGVTVGVRRPLVGGVRGTLGSPVPRYPPHFPLHRRGDMRPPVRSGVAGGARRPWVCIRISQHALSARCAGLTRWCSG